MQLDLKPNPQPFPYKGTGAESKPLELWGSQSVRCLFFHATPHTPGGG
ncbi:MAG: hypothetical protein PUQ00_03595 [Nostoc sp. S13]|nr:hypothetical protein [Nostoc sp. S13]